MTNEKKPSAQLTHELNETRTQLVAAAAQVSASETAVSPPDPLEKAQALIQLLDQQFGQVADIDPLITNAINETQSIFDYYHVQVYLTTNLLDQINYVIPHYDNEHLILYAGTGEIGNMRKAQGHHIPLKAKRSLVAQAARTRQPIIVNHTHGNSKFLPHSLLANTQAEAALPLMSGQQLMGVLDIQHTIPNCFDKDHIRALVFIARQLAFCLARSTLLAQTITLQTQLQALQELSDIIRNTQNEDELITVATTFISKIGRADNYGFRLVDPQSRTLRSHPSYHKTIGKKRALAITGPGEGITGRVLTTGKPWLIGDVSQEPAFLGDPEIHSELCVPINIGDKTIGVINMESRHHRAFAETDLKLMMALASQVATAIEKFRLSIRFQRQVIKNDTLLSTMKAISSLQLENVLNILAQEAKRLLDSDTSRIHLVSGDDEWLQGAVVQPSAVDAVRAFPVKIGHGITGSVALSGVGEIIPNTRLDRRAVYVPGTPEHDTTAVFVPLKLRHRVVGVMSVARQDLSRPYTQEDMELLTVIADQAAIAIENARLWEAEQRKGNELRVLRVVAIAGAEAHSEGDLIERVTRFIGQHLYQDSFGVMLLDEVSQVLRTHYSYWGPQMTVPIARSIAGHVVATGQLFHTPDVTQEKDYFEAEHFDIGDQMYAKLCVPLRVDNEIIGVVNVESKQRQAFDETDQYLILTLAQQLSTAITKVRLFEMEQRRARQQHTLATTAGTLLSALNLHDLWATLTTTIRETLSAERTAVYLYSQNEARFVCVFADGFASDYMDFFNQHADQMPSNQLLHTNQPLVINDVLQHTLYAAVAHRIASEGFHAVALFPIRTTKMMLGVMGAYRDTPTPFTDDDIITGQTLAQIVTIALQNVQLFAEKHHALVREKRLNEIARILNVERNLPAVLSTVVRAATELVGAEAGALGLIVDGSVMIHYPYNLPEQAQLRPLPRGRGSAWYVAETAVSISVDEYATHHTADSHWVDLGVRAYLGVPVMSNDICLGTLSLFHFMPGRKFAAHAQELAEAIAHQAGITIQNLRLFEEAQQRANFLAVSLARQERVDRLKDVFIQNISHELRTPLGIILGHAELLESGVLGALQSTQQDSIKIITRRVNMLTELVNDLSVLLAAQTQEFRREPIHPRQLILSMLDDFKLQAEAHDVHLRSNIETDLPWITGDATHLRRVFDNLMSNAFKFTSAGGNVTLRVWRAGDDVIFEVSDTGIGMPPDQLERIFERFYQVQQKKKTHPGGTGLGLALVKEIIEAHRGYIRVLSEEGKGSTFEITLPGFELAAPAEEGAHT